MFEFIEKFQNRRALKKALKEVELEDSFDSKLTTNNSKVKREYKTKDEGAYAVIKKPFSISKPETTAVDLKDFKNWRDIDTVDSSFPKSSNSFDFNDDKGGSSKNSNKNSMDILGDSYVNFGKEKPENIDKNPASYIREKYLNQGKTQPEPQQPEKPAEKPMRKKTTLNELLAKKIKEGKISPTNLPDKKQETQTEPVKEPDPVEQLVEKHQIAQAEEAPTIKVEVVKFDDDKEKPKKKVNRRPRGKNKRRFDADVISSVEWK